MIIKGFRFGMLLQLAVGPVCVLVFRTAADAGFWGGLQIVLAVALVDALFIALAGAGAAALLNREAVKRAVRFAGCLVLMLFGLQILLGAFGVQLLPQVRLFAQQGGGLFWQGFLLTASNPLTILFWSGMLTARMAENRWNKQQLALFAAGCVLSTLVFLSAVAALGTVAGGFLPPLAIQALNALVGAALIFYGLRLLIRKEKAAQA